MTHMPKLWQYLTDHWLSLEPSLARSWWYALAHARWSLAAQWREAFLAFAHQDGTVSRDYVHTFFQEMATLPRLIQLLEALGQERVLLAREKRKLEEALLAQANADGVWTHGAGRPQRA